MPSSKNAKSHKGFLSGLARALTHRWKRLKSAFGGQHYQPEKHYMRGPGPKAKQGGDGGKTPGAA
jgi:hypothetical protein